MSCIGIPIAVLIMFVAQRVERHLGAAAAGWVAALPISFGVASAALAVTGRRADASLIAISAAGHLAAQIDYAIAFVWVSARRGVLQALAAGILVYAAASIVLLPTPYVVRIALGVGLWVIGIRFMVHQPPATKVANGQSTAKQILSLASAAFVVAFITIANHYVGPAVTGAIGAFPTMSTTIALFVARRSNVTNANSVMNGLVRSLPCYVTYCVTFAVVIMLAPVLIAVLVAGSLALFAARISWRGLSATRDPNLACVPAHE